MTGSIILGDEIESGAPARLKRHIGIPADRIMDHEWLIGVLGDCAPHRCRPGNLTDEAILCFLRAGAPGHWRQAPESTAAARAFILARLGFTPPLRALVGGARALTADDGTWAPLPGEWRAEGERGQPVITVAVMMGFAAHELLALDPEDPTRFWRRTGLVDVAGFGPLDPAFEDWLAQKRVRLARTPFAWLKARSAPACVLDPDSYYGQRLLFDGPIACDDDAHALAMFQLRGAELRWRRRDAIGKTAEGASIIGVAA